MSEQAATIIAADDAATDDPNAARDAMLKLLGKNFAAPKKAARKEREKKVSKMVDGRSLRSKGRTTQFNVMIKPEIKQAILDRAKEEGVSMADLTELAFLKLLEMRSN